VPLILARRWRTVALVLLAVLVAASAAVLVVAGRRQAPLSVRDVDIEVIDGPAGASERVRIDGALYLPRLVPAPAVLVAHGFGGTKLSVDAQARELAERGFVVLAYSARGFGSSTGEIALNAPDYEVADARQLVDWLATLPEVVSDGPGDPRVGVTGASYGGALALSLAGTDHRVDALAPLITWNDLSQALLPNAAVRGGPPAGGTPAAGFFRDVDSVDFDSDGDGAPAAGVFKRSWAGIFFGAGLSPGADAGPRGVAPEAGVPASNDPGRGGGSGSDTSPGNATPGNGTAGGGTAGGGSAAGGAAPGSDDLMRQGCGRFRIEVCRAYVEVATTGRAGPSTVELLRRASPAAVASRITAPTLLVQGELDTLFGLDQADATARQIAAAGGTVKMIWYSGGHDGGAPGQRLRSKIAGWFDYHLAGRGPNPGTGFEYAVRGNFQRVEGPSVRTMYAPSYPGLSTGDGVPDGDGRTGDDTVQRREFALAGSRQPVFAPPGGSPAAVSSVPGLGSLGSAAAAVGGLAVDVPGQTATFGTQPLDEHLLIAGTPRVRLLVGAVPGMPAADAVLFAKLYDVAPNGQRALPGGGVAPLRVSNLPADGTPVEVTVALPGIVRAVEPGHRLHVVVSTTDQAYAVAPQPAVYTVALASAAGLSVPVVPGRSTADTGVPASPLVGTAAVLGAVALLAALAALQRRRAGRRRGVRADLAQVPLVIERLTKAYPGGLTAVDGLSIRVESGQVLGLLGPNGAGKTTTLRMLVGLIRPGGGEIRVFGHPVRPGAAVLSRIGAFIEGPGFLPHLSGLDNLRLYWAATGRPSQTSRMAEALEVAGLGSAVHRKVATYSHGMKQRLAIAQAMLGMPDLLVLDEPTNGLDPPQIREMRDVLRRYAAAGRTVVISSHLLSEVEQTCTHVVVMHHGRLVATGEVSDIIAGGGQASFRVGDPSSAVAVLRAAPGVANVVAEGPVVHADLDGLPRSSAVAALVQAGVAVEQAGPRRRLEDAFLQLVAEDPEATP
jgi:ABC-2 type transport system ATP-binding protein